MLGQEQIHRNLSSHPPNIATQPQKTFLPRFPRPMLPEQWAVIWQPWRMSRNTWTPHDDKTGVWIYNVIPTCAYLASLYLHWFEILKQTPTLYTKAQKSEQLAAASWACTSSTKFWRSNQVLPTPRSKNISHMSRRWTGGTNLQSLQELAGRCANHHLCLRSHQVGGWYFLKTLKGWKVQMTNDSMILQVKLNLSMGQAG